MKRKIEVPLPPRPPPPSSSQSQLNTTGSGQIPPAFTFADGLNPYTRRPLTSKFHDIFAKRKLLPVYVLFKFPNSFVFDFFKKYFVIFSYEFRDELVEKVKNNQVVIIEGLT